MRQNEKDTLVKMIDGERLYKYTGAYPWKVSFEKSEEKVPLRTFDGLFKKALIKVDDASSFETWYTLTDIGRKFASQIKDQE